MYFPRDDTVGALLIMNSRKIRRLHNEMNMASVLGACWKGAQFSLFVINSASKEIVCSAVELFEFLEEENGSINCKYFSSMANLNSLSLS